MSDNINNIELNDISDELLIIPKQTIDTLFQLDNCADCIALYVFYYKTAKWQNTNIIKANDTYIKKSLKWGMTKIRNTKQSLKENGLIDIVQRRKDGKISGWYVKVSYMINPKNINDIKIQVDNESNNTQNEQVAKSTSCRQKTNTIKYNINTNKYNINTRKNFKTEKKVDIPSSTQTHLEENNIKDTSGLHNSSKRKTKKDKAIDFVISKFEEYDFSDSVKEKLLDFYEDQITRGNYPANNQLTIMFNELSEVSEQKQLEAISNSIKQGYKGIFISNNFKSKNQSYKLDEQYRESAEEHNQNITQLQDKIDNVSDDIHIF